MKATVNNTIEQIKSDIKDRLRDYAGVKVYGCDLAYKLFEGENVNGSVFCNTYKTKEYIKNNFDLFGDFLEHYKDNFGEYLNPFAEPEKVHVCFLLEAVQCILSKCEFVKENWNDEFELTDEVISDISAQVDEFSGDLF